MIARFFQTILLLVLGLLSSSLWAETNALPDLSGPEERPWMIQQEKKLGAEFIREIRLHEPLLRDPLILDYIQTLGRGLAVHTQRPVTQFHFFVLDSAEINAFSGPDGYIGVNGGVILRAQQENELAAVLAHEIAHVSQKHLTQMLVEQKSLSLSKIGALLAAIALGVYNPNAALGVYSAAQAGEYEHLLNFTRAHEAEADRIGSQILTKAGYDVRGMSSFFRRMTQEELLNQTEFSEFFRTHPQTESRLADADYRLNSASHPAKKDTIAFHLIQGRVRVAMSSNRDELLREVNQQVRGGENLSWKYAQVLALMATDHYQEAKKNLVSLMNRYPDQMILKMTLAEIENGLGQYQAAQSQLENLYRLYPKSYGILMIYANVLMRQKAFSSVIKLLESQEQNYHYDENYLALLSRAEGESGHWVKAYQTRAKLLLLIGDVPAAKEQLEMAVKYAKDSIEKRKIQRVIDSLEKRG